MINNTRKKYKELINEGKYKLFMIVSLKTLQGKPDGIKP